jgi:hypothetical protein
LHPVGIDSCEVATVVTVAQAVVGFGQRPSGDVEESGELARPVSAKPLSDIARDG